MITYKVSFEPIFVTEEVAKELKTADPLGERAELEVEILKIFCPTEIMFTKNKRPPFPIISNIEKIEDQIKQYTKSDIEKLKNIKVRRVKKNDNG